MKLSVITTMYQSAPFLEEFYRRVRDVANSICHDFEIVFVNDGSPDDSLDIALELCREDERVKVVDLSRNFGHHKAMMTGLMHAQGELVFQVDCDLEEEPEFLREFYDKLRVTEADVVYGVQKSRKGNWFERIAGGIFWQSLGWLSSESIPRNQTMMRLMTRRYVDGLIAHRDHALFLPGLWTITGFTQVAVPLVKLSREGSSYTLRRKVAQAVDSITSFSSAPLVGIFYLGTLIMLISCSAALTLIAVKLSTKEFQAGWPSLIVSIWFLGGLTIFCIGIVGIYLSKVFLEVKDRPLTVVRHVHRQMKQEDTPIQDNVGVETHHSQRFRSHEASVDETTDMSGDYDRATGGSR